MPDNVPIHEFDELRAMPFRSRSDFVKTAILLHLADPDAVVEVKAPFGREVMKGDFYLVSSAEGSYGAAKKEFEAGHVEVAPDRWVKRSLVMAYRATEICRVDTILADGTHEVTVEAQTGDWIVRQALGEVMVVKPNAFADRYEPAD